MSCSCAPIFVGVASLVSEILLLSKTTKFPFQPMDYSPWSSKNLIDGNWLKKFMQVEIGVKCMYNNFGGCSLSGFGDTAFKNGQISMVIKKFNWLKKSMQVGIDVKFMCTDFCGRVPSSFGDTVTLKNDQISLSIHGL